MRRHTVGLLWFNIVCSTALLVLVEVIGEPEINSSRNYNGILPSDPRVLNHAVACPPTCPADCKDIQDLGNGLDGPYAVYKSTDDYRPVVVYCDMETTGGGWLVFQRRADGSENFFRNWTEYEDGFGDNVRGTEFWLGLRDLHLLLAQKRYRLRVDLSDYSGSTAYQEYQYFSVAPTINKYSLSLWPSGVSGNAGDSLLTNNGMQFSVPEQDNDAQAANCARDNNRGGWWYSTCGHSNLNGVYSNNTVSTSATNVNWYHWTNSWRPLKKTEMKFRPM